MAKKKLKKIIGKDEWSLHENRFVCFIDVMGFKDLVAREKPKDVFTKMKKISDSQNWSGKIFEDENLKTAKDVRCTTYSDSSIIYSRDSSKECVRNFFLYISGLINEFFRSEIPFKGAVAFGMVSIDFNNSIFFGQPLIDALQMHDELNFYGVVLHSTAERKLDKSFKGKMEYTISSECYFKNTVSEHVSIYPMEAVNADRELLKFVKKLKHNTSGSLRKYIDNTVKYFDAIYKKIQGTIIRSGEFRSIN